MLNCVKKMELKTKEGKQIKVRIKPFISFGDPRYKVEIKRWWGWETVYDARLIDYAIEYINELSKVRNVLWLK